ncbi:hypothetical protein [Sulfurimonas sp.]
MDNLRVFYNQISVELLSFITDSLVGFVALVLFVSSFIKRANHTLIGAWISNFLGVFFHELAHAVVGALLYAKPTNFVVIPKKIENNGETVYLLGHVDFKNLRWYNSFLSGMAPFLLLFIAGFIENNYWIYFEKNLLNYLLYVYLLVVFIVNAIPSSQDFKVSFGNILGIIFGVSIVLFLLFLLSNNNITIAYLYKIL